MSGHCSPDPCLPFRALCSWTGGPSCLILCPTPPSGGPRTALTSWIQHTRPVLYQLLHPHWSQVWNVLLSSRTLQGEPLQGPCPLGLLQPQHSPVYMGTFSSRIPSAASPALRSREWHSVTAHFHTAAGGKARTRTCLPTWDGQPSLRAGLSVFLRAPTKRGQSPAGELLHSSLSRITKNASGSSKPCLAQGQDSNCLARSCDSGLKSEDDTVRERPPHHLNCQPLQHQGRKTPSPPARAPSPPPAPALLSTFIFHESQL